MKKAKIAVKQYSQTKSMKIADDLGLAEDDIASIRSKLAGIEEEEKKLTYRVVKTATPYSIMLTDSGDDKPPIATLFILCTDKDGFFVLYHNYIIEDEDDIEKLKANPLFVDNQFMSNNILFSRLATLDKYNTDLNLYTSDSDEYSMHDYSFYVLGYIKDKEDNIIKLYLDSFATNIIMYTDNYICAGARGEGYENQLSNNLYIESFFTEDKPKTIFVDSIEDVQYLSVLDKKTGVYEVIFKIKNPDSNSETDKYFGISNIVVIKDNKGIKPNIGSVAMGAIKRKDKDKYSTIFDYTCTINDKDYIGIKSFNLGEDNESNGSLLIYMDEDTNNSIIDMIKSKFSK